VCACVCVRACVRVCVCVGVECIVIELHSYCYILQGDIEGAQAETNDRKVIPHHITGLAET